MKPGCKKIGGKKQPEVRQFRNQENSSLSSPAEIKIGNKLGAPPMRQSRQSGNPGFLHGTSTLDTSDRRCSGHALGITASALYEK